MKFKTVLDYIQSLKRADFDPCTLSVKGYADQFLEVKKQFGCDFFSFFFNHIHILDSNSIVNFLKLVYTTETFQEVLEIAYNN